MMGLRLPWHEDARSFGSGTAFGECSFDPDILAFVDALITAGHSHAGLADLVEIEREANDAAFGFSLNGIDAALSSLGDADRVQAVWRVAANYGAAAVLGLCAHRCAQLGTYSLIAEGEA